MPTSSKQLLAEWSPQWAVMFTWPHQFMDWHNLTEVEAVYIQLIKAISPYERLLIVCHDNKHQQYIRQQLQCLEDLSPCQFVIATSNDAWARDHGPISIKQHGHTQLLDFQFNGWGHKYPAQLDNEINQKVFKQQLKQNIESIDFVLEGGSIETDGNGSLLTTRRCLLNPARNPAYSEKQIENLLKEKLGIQQILWLTHGALSGDDTDSHIDTLARFCNPRTLMYASCHKDDAEHFDELNKMQQELQTFKNIDGEPYQLIPIPLPDAIYHQGQRLPASYLNFLIINQAVLLPIYNDEKDAQVISIFESAFKQYKIITINCLPIIQQFGSLHCLCMQLAE